jgi:hypothetical protein
MEAVRRMRVLRKLYSLSAYLNSSWPGEKKQILCAYSPFLSPLITEALKTYPAMVQDAVAGSK